MRRRGVKRNKRSFRRRGGRSTFRIAKAALRGVKKIKSSIETKFHDVSGLFNVAAPPAYTITLLSGVPQGTKKGERIGVDINPSSIFLRYRITALGASANNTVRVVLFKDLDPDGIAPTEAHLFERQDILSPLLRANSSRFHVIYDKVHILYGNTGDGVGKSPGIVFKKMYKRISGTTKLVGTGGDITNASKNHYFLAFGTDVAASRAGVDFEARLNYKDP